MHFAKGEVVTIYDAEDIPDPQQLRQVVAVFAAYPDIACVQAQLNFYNAEESWLARFFAMEYTMLFQYMLPALYWLKIPIPLGGTSNHIRRNVLQKLGAWDVQCYRRCGFRCENELRRLRHVATIFYNARRSTTGCGLMDKTAHMLD